jgi:hypothetical protein
MQQARRGRAEHRAGHSAASAAPAHHHVRPALGCGGEDRLPRLARAARDGRLGREPHRFRELGALRGGRLRLGNQLLLELGDVLLDEVGAIRPPPARNAVTAPTAGSWIVSTVARAPGKSVPAARTAASAAAELSNAIRRPAAIAEA